MSHLTVEQRYTIDRMLTKGHTQTEVASVLGKDKSEVSRNCDQRNGVYKLPPCQQENRERQACKPQKIRFTARVKKYVEDKLEKNLRPIKPLAHHWA